jgi:hypothetical protein
MAGARQLLGKPGFEPAREQGAPSAAGASHVWLAVLHVAPALHTVQLELVGVQAAHGFPAEAMPMAAHCFVEASQKSPTFRSQYGPEVPVGSHCAPAVSPPAWHVPPVHA